MRWAGRRRVSQLVHRVGDAAPYWLPIIIILGCKFIGARGAFLDDLVAVPPEHQVGGMPDVDLGYRARSTQESYPDIVIFTTFLL